MSPPPEVRPASERERFEAELRPVLGLAYRVASRLSGSPDDAMDLVQDAAVLAFKGFAQFRAGTNFKAWFLKIVTHRYYQSRRDAHPLPTVSIDEAPDLFLYLQARRLGLPMDGDPVGELLAKTDTESVCDALDRLPEEYRVVATLYFLSGLSYEELAVAVDAPLGTVRSRLHRARKMLQVALWRIGEERGYVEERTER